MMDLEGTPSTPVPAESANQGASGLPKRKSPDQFSDDIVLGQYRLYADTIEKAADRRAGSNHFYVTLHTSLIIALGTVGGYGIFTVAGTTSSQPNSFLTQLEAPVIAIVSVVGIILALTWRNSVKSFAILQSAKFEVLHEMETWLPFQAFKREEVKLKDKHRPEATRIEAGLAWLTMLLYLSLLITYFVMLFRA